MVITSAKLKRTGGRASKIAIVFVNFDNFNVTHTSAQ